MLRIRLRRVGKKGNPSYRIVVADSRAPRDGDYLEWIGNYDPMADPPAVVLKEDRAAQWLSKGAQPSDAVARLLDKNGLFQRTEEFRTPTRKSADKAPAAPATPAAPVATATEDTPAADEAPVDEAPVDEAPAEDTPEEEAPEETPEPDAPEDEASVEDEATPEEVEDEPSEEPSTEEESDEASEE